MNKILFLVCFTLVITFGVVGSLSSKDIVKPSALPWLQEK